MKRILFSPIGTTDPISNCADGPLLHICRVYRPDLVYLYLSKEICEIQNKDDRYRYSLSRLSKATGHDLEITSIERNELTDVHEFDYFYNEFKNILKEIHEKFPEAEILLNVSSGTPAMQCTLYSLAVLGEFAGLSAIQVSTPEKKHNPRRDRLEDYDKELYWETNEDNSDNFTNRCKILEEKNALARFTEKTIQ
ncbi:MAG: hypothetical protein LBQ96_02945 [Fusobacteriaceae bacterium]|jgi:hypothetical protein|nr:hypothetical protein [Fusobacteriaceae bacterium]